MKSQQNPDGLPPDALRARQKEQVLTFLNRELAMLGWSRRNCEEREQKEEEARQSAAVLPSVAVLDKIMRYETTLQRQLFRAMTQLERLQRMRQGEVIPAQMTVEVSERRE